MERMHFRAPVRRLGRGIERRKNTETLRLKAAIERIIVPPIGDPPTPPKGLRERFKQLEDILTIEPQRAADGRLRYLVTSGLAVEMVTGFRRDHHDIDLVVMDPDDTNRWDLIGTDNVTPGEYWADMEFDAKFLETTAREATMQKGATSPVVEVVHPGIIMVQKASDAFGRPPRRKDEDDVSAIIRYWKESERYTKDWNPIIRRSLDALPNNQVDRTLTRLRRAIS